MVRDTSMFQGVKELEGPCGIFRLERRCSIWTVFEFNPKSNAFICIGNIMYHDLEDETNDELYERVINNLCDNEYDDEY